MQGYMGAILRVDTGRRAAVEEKLSEFMRERFVGGRGFAVKILWRSEVWIPCLRKISSFLRWGL